MQLLYLWVEDYKCLKKIGFNFSPRHRFEYNIKNRTIKYCQNDENIEDFFKYDKIKNKRGVDNLTLVIGNNGAGKTTLINFILNSFTIKNTLIEGIFIFLDNDNIKIYYNIPYLENEERHVYLEADVKLLKYFIKESEKYEVLNKLKGKSTIEKCEIEDWDCFIGNDSKVIDECINDLQKTHFIFYSNIFTDEYSHIVRSKGVSDISTVGLIKSDMNYDYEMGFINLDKNPNGNFFNHDFLRQIQFVNNYKGIKEAIPFKLPEYVYVGFADVQPVMNKIYKALDDEYGISRLKKYIDKNSNSKDVKKILLCNILKVDNFIKCFVRKQPELKVLPRYKVEVVDFYTKLIRGIFTGVLYNIIPGIVDGNNYSRYGYINTNIELEILKKINLVKHINDLFEVVINFCREMLLKFDANRINNQYINSINKLKNCISSEFIKSISYNSLSGIFRLKVNKKDNEKLKMNELEQFFQTYKNTVIEFNYLEFSWPISSGEYSFLSIFARFYSLILKEEIDESIEDIIILIDEGDISLHPEWQQKYIKFLLKYLQNIYENYNLQLVITTHSPILLSDIPSSNVVYIKKDEDKMPKIEKENPKTFAANIYDIYRKGFYLQKSNFGIIGEFALDKIKEVEDTLKEISEEDNHYSIGDVKFKLEYCRKIINIIGEEFVRNLLQAKYDKVLNMLYKKEKGKSNSRKLNELKNDFEKLSNEDQRSLIKYIIQRTED